MISHVRDVMAAARSAGERSGIALVIRCAWGECEDKSLPHKVGLRIDSAPARMHNLKLNLQIQSFCFGRNREMVQWVNEG